MEIDWDSDWRLAHCKDPAGTVAVALVVVDQRASVDEHEAVGGLGVEEAVECD
jgi:hypothetical protein